MPLPQTVPGSKRACDIAPGGAERAPAMRSGARISERCPSRFSNLSSTRPARLQASFLGLSP
eukprot:7786481-Pyramimonas_sp.AAC.1